eukprot:11667257-Prorocentrum_lima.AAC.1
MDDAPRDPRRPGVSEPTLSLAPPFSEAASSSPTDVQGAHRGSTAEDMDAGAAQIFGDKEDKTGM